MALELKQSLKMSQRIIMTPQLQQAIKFLQLSRLELSQTVNQEMEANPLLEEVPGDEMEERLTTLGNTLTETVTSYKAVLVQANPDVIEELITGDTIETINESLGRAKDLVSRVRQGLENEISLARVPAGAPERTAPDFSGLSPREKIQQAIATSR